MRKPGKLLLLLSAALLAHSPLRAETEAAMAQDAAQANNPLADIQAFNIQNYYIPEISGVDDTANTMWARYVQPFGNWLFRGSLPFSRVPTATGESTSGMGDLNAFMAYIFDSKTPGRMYGIGPEIILPTATDDATGTGKYQAGVAAVYWDATSTTFQWGGLVTWQTSVAGDDDRDDVRSLVAQPFYFFQLGEGLYVRGAPIWVFDLEQNTYNMPVGLGLGKVFPTAKVVYNAFIEPQFTVLSKGPGQPEFQVFMGFNMQFR